MRKLAGTASLVVLCLQRPALAQEDGLASLAIADQAQASAGAPSAWRGFIEGAAGISCDRTGSCGGVNERLSLNIGLDKALAPGFRLVVEDRLDLNSSAQLLFPKNTNSLKEAYLDWRAADSLMLTAGRINMRYGVAQGYSPNDVFRAHSLRTIVSTDPVANRANRLGTVALRNQAIWDSGGLSTAFVPKITSERSTAVFSPDFGATNAHDAWLVAVSQRLAPGVVPQWLYYQQAGSDPQLGMNLSLALSDSIVAFGEWKGGRGPSLLAQFLGANGAASMQNQATAGLTISAAKDVTMTLEYQYNSAGLTRRQWQELGQLAPDARAKYLAMVRDLQDNPTPHAAFALLRWENFMVRKLDLSALAQVNLDDRSWMWWLELLYRAGPVDAALQLQANIGGAESTFGMTPPRRGWQLLLRYHY